MLFILFGCLRKIQKLPDFLLPPRPLDPRPVTSEPSAHLATPPNRVCVRRKSQIAKWQMAVATGDGEPRQRWRLSTLPSGFVARCWLHFVNFHSFAVFTNLKICLCLLALAGAPFSGEYRGWDPAGSVGSVASVWQPSPS